MYKNTCLNAVALCWNLMLYLIGREVTAQHNHQLAEVQVPFASNFFFACVFLANIQYTFFVNITVWSNVAFQNDNNSSRISNNSNILTSNLKIKRMLWISRRFWTSEEFLRKSNCSTYICMLTHSTFPFGNSPDIHFIENMV